jgi:hypothetical protein
MKLKILLTGADGFLGRACISELQSVGHDIVTTDRLGKVDHVGDLAGARFCETLPEVNAVVHAAAVQYASKYLPLGPRHSYFYRNNVEATRLLCRRYSDGTTHFVNIGTSMMYAQNGSLLYRTNSPMEGQGVYSRSKLAAQDFRAKVGSPDKRQTVSQARTRARSSVSAPGPALPFADAAFRQAIADRVHGEPRIVPDSPEGGRFRHPAHHEHPIGAAICRSAIEKARG